MPVPEKRASKSAVATLRKWINSMQNWP